MKSQIFTLLVLLFTWPCISISQDGTYIPPGNVSGTWEANGSPYLVQGDIVIPDGELLTIEPGVEVIFQGHFRFNVNGQLLAQGTVDDSIRFTAFDNELGWHHMAINSNPSNNDTIRLEYCIIEYGNANGGPFDDDNMGGGIVVGYADIVISHCLIHHNSCSGEAPWGPAYGGGIYIALTDAILTYNTIIHNTAEVVGGGIIIGGSNAPFLKNNVIAFNECTNASEGGGLVIWANSNPVLINNTIANNYTGGVSIQDNCDPEFINTIIWGNTITSGSNVSILDDGGCPSFFYSDIEGGFDGFSGGGSGINFCGYYDDDCIDDDPLFMDPENDDFQLTGDSPCIDAGDPSSPPDPDGTICDIGAYYFLQTNIDDHNSARSGSLKVYPNPAHNVSSIEFCVSNSGFVSLFLIDVTGKEIDELISEHLTEGTHKYELNMTHIKEGIFYLRLYSLNTLETIKIVKIK